MNIDLFQFNDYRAYLREEFPSAGKKRGRRAELARMLSCQTSFISQVLSDRSQFSLDQAIRVARFLSLEGEQKKYFIYLVQKDRAHSEELKKYCENELKELRRKRNQIKERIGVKTKIVLQDQIQYYSSWHYAAIHVLSAFPEYRSIDAIANRLGIKATEVDQALEFLIRRGFVKPTVTGFVMGKTRIHLPKGSEMLSRHHQNWRLKVMDALGRESEQDLHYTAILGLSRKDKNKFKERILELIQEFEVRLSKSKVETAEVLIMDFFKL